MDEKFFDRISGLLVFFITWMKTSLIEYPLNCYIYYFLAAFIFKKDERTLKKKYSITIL